MKRTVFTLVLSMLFLLTAAAFISAEGKKESSDNNNWENGMMDGNDSFRGQNSYGRMGGPNSNNMMGNNGSYGMMGNGMMGNGMMGNGYNSNTPPGERLTIDEAKDKVLEYLSDRRMENLELNEIMEFQGNFYAQVKESDTGINAFELLVDPYYGYVSSEPGPNMMWNAKYGPMGGLSSEDMSLSEKDAITKAGEFLSANSADLEAENHADVFYGYYTIHTVKDGIVEGMLSVNGYTGDVWYHSWHGSFVKMEESSDNHS